MGGDPSGLDSLLTALRINRIRKKKPRVPLSLVGDARGVVNNAMSFTYLVTSFDFGGESNVNVHAITDDMATAESVYSSVLQACDAENAKYQNSACKMLAELTRVPTNVSLLGPNAVTLFWGQNSIKNNNN